MDKIDFVFNGYPKEQSIHFDAERWPVKSGKNDLETLKKEWASKLKAHPNCTVEAIARHGALGQSPYFAIGCDKE
jgi:hypothetical protein